MEQSVQNIKNAAGLDVKAMMNVLMEEATKLTSSKLAYFATMSDDEEVLTMVGWSMSAMENCKLIAKPIVYLLEDTGLWGDCVRERKPVITNDYKNLSKPTKKGYPGGHVDVVKHMNVPLTINNKIVAVLGVGNKDADYTSTDANTLIDFLGQVWPTIKAKL